MSNKTNKNFSRYHCECSERLHQQHYIEGNLISDAQWDVEVTRCSNCNAIFRDRTLIENSNE